MHHKKINDALLLELHRQGLNQVQIAKRLGVSNVAVHKRLKRLLPPPLPKGFEKLTEKEQRFCLEKAQGKTATQAVMDSYEVTSRASAKVIGSQLMAKPEIQSVIRELMEQEGLTRRYRIRRLKEHIDNPDGLISLKALDMSFKLDDSYPATKIEQKNYSIHITDETLQELIQIHREIQEHERTQKLPSGVPSEAINGTNGEPDGEN